MKRIVCPLVVGAIVLALPTVVRAQSATFDFTTVPISTTTPFGTTVNGITATFSSPGDPAQFITTNAVGFSTLSGPVLADPGSVTAISNEPLIVSFSQPLTNMSVKFATDDSGPASPFQVQAFLGGVGGTPEGSNAVAGSVPPGFTFPEGVLGFSGGPWDTLEFNTLVPTKGVPAAPAFTIGDLFVSTGMTPPPVPEPGSLALAAGGALGLLTLRRRRA